MLTAALAAPGQVDDDDRALAPLNGGSLLLLDISFIRSQAMEAYWPGLVFTVQNQTTTPWDRLMLQLDVAGTCQDGLRQWKIPVLVESLEWSETRAMRKKYDSMVLSLMGKVDDCTAEIFKARVMEADYADGDVHIKNQLPDVDMKKELTERREQRAKEQTRRDEALRKAEALRAAKNAEAKRQAAETAERERQREIAERERTRKACTALYQSTANKKLAT